MNLKLGRVLMFHAGNETMLSLTTSVNEPLSWGICLK
ncbi:hypothetical protein Mal48_24290 [Thalassoglobus polymorphus]|uniref:Uncharacterized protein n=1 Tax=Thalassoglobus polymorphus TaxID=2527994 RepID=A0A517QNH1_9PLAN|nr:hypothetical protein Mal48_24290 [Thalassoglobus polymorphus]